MSGPRKRASGPTQTEDARKAKQRLLRLLPRVDRALAKRAAARGMTASAYVSWLVMEDVAAASSAGE